MQWALHGEKEVVCTRYKSHSNLKRNGKKKSQEQLRHNWPSQRRQFFIQFCETWHLTTHTRLCFYTNWGQWLFKIGSIVANWNTQLPDKLSGSKTGRSSACTIVDGIFQGLPSLIFYRVLPFVRIPTKCIDFFDYVAFVLVLPSISIKGGTSCVITMHQVQGTKLGLFNNLSFISTIKSHLNNYIT